MQLLSKFESHDRGSVVMTRPIRSVEGKFFWVRGSDSENRKKNATQLTFAVLALSSWGARKYVHNGIKNAQNLLIKHTSKTLIQKDAMHPNSRHAYQKARVMLRQRRLSEAKLARQRQRSAKGTYSFMLSDHSNKYSGPNYGICSLAVRR